MNRTAHWWDRGLLVLTKWRLWWLAISLSVLLSCLIVSGMSWWLEGVIDSRHLIMGVVTALVVSGAVGGLIIYTQTQMAQQYLRSTYWAKAIRVCPIPMAIKDDQDRILLVNPKFTELFGYTTDDTPTLDILLLKLYPAQEDRQRLRQQWQAQLDFIDTQPVSFTPLETDVLCRNMHHRSVQVSTAHMVHNQRHLMLISFLDVTEQRQQEVALRIAATAFESQEGMLICNTQGKILKVNRAFTQITGYAPDEVEGRSASLLKSGIHDSEFYSAMWNRIHAEGHWHGEVWNRRKNSEIYPEWLTITAVRSPAGEITHYIGAMQDITQRKAVEAQVQHMAHHDALTDLPNRMLLNDRLGQALATAQRDQGLLAVLFMDLDRFKPVNDNLGHEIGDQVLMEVAKRLRTCVKRGTDTVARLGGDEFVVLLTHLQQPDDASLVANQIIDSISQPYFIKSHHVSIGCSLGIALYPQHGDTPRALIKNADTAMYQAKQLGRGRCATYQPDSPLLEPSPVA